MRKKKQAWRGRLVDALYVAGAGLVSAGIWLWCASAGLVVAGAFTLAASVLIDRGNGSTRKTGGEEQ